MRRKSDLEGRDDLQDLTWRGMESSTTMNRLNPSCVAILLGVLLIPRISHCQHDYRTSQEAADSWAAANYSEAIQILSHAIESDKSQIAIRNQLVKYLLKCPDRSCRNAGLALHIARESCELTDWRDDRCLSHLALAYSGHYMPERAAYYQEKAILLAKEEHLLARYRKNLNGYKRLNKNAKWKYPRYASTITKGERLLLHVNFVLIGTELENKDQLCERWLKSPSVVVFGGTAQDHQLVREVTDQINQVLHSTGIRLGAPSIETDLPSDGRFQTADGQIFVFFASRQQFDSLAKINGIPKIPSAYFAVNARFRNERKEIERAAAFIPNDEQYRDRIRHFVVEELTQCLGPCRDSPVFPGSIFYESPESHGTAVELSPLDKRILMLLYERCLPGDSGDEIRRRVISEWPEFKIP